MPCYRCGARQTDPVRGASPWRRGVRADVQVLVCPDCQQDSSWPNDLDQCPGCGSTALFRRLGATVCRDCEARRLAGTAATPPPARDASSGEAAESTSVKSATRSGEGDYDLAREVAAAIDRLLGRA